MDRVLCCKRLSVSLFLLGVLVYAIPASPQVLLVPAHTHPGNAGFQKSGSMSKADTALARLFAEHRAHVNTKTAAPFESSNRFIGFHNGRVLIEASATSSGDLLLPELVSLGLQGAARYGAIISGWLPVATIERAVALQNLQSISAVREPVRNTGLVTSQGDVALRADIARQPAVHDVDGTGITVAVLSDSYDKSTFTLIRAADDIASGDLPAGDPVLNAPPNEGEYSLCGITLFCIDEGRAMLQIVHDLAPGANLLFHTALDTSVRFANAIKTLAAAGADVIVDDLFYLNEPMFQDGIVAQAVDEVVADGAVYLSAAGNGGRRSYEAAFDDSGEDLCIDFIPDGVCDPIFELVGDMHDFDPGAGVDFYQSVTIPIGATITVSFQWDSPFGNVHTGDGPDNDHILLLLDHTGGVMLAISANDNVSTGNPYEIIQYTNIVFDPDTCWGGPTCTEFNIVITYDGADSPGPPAELMKTVIYGSDGIDYNEYQTFSPTVIGHANAAGAIAVGAAYFGDTPEFGTSPPLRAPYSSAGGTPILFDTNGDPLGAPEIRGKPEVTAVDGVNTTFFWIDDDPLGGDGVPDFFGTSAAAPHAAAVAALMREAYPASSPAHIDAALKASAIDMDDPGFDFDSGYGLIQADAAITELLDGGGNNLPGADFTWSASDLTADFTDASSDTDGSVVGWDWDFGDSSGATTQNPSHTYAAGSTYTVSLTVTDNDGGMDTRSKDVTVTEPSGNTPPVAAYDYGCIAKDCTFIDTSTDVDGDATIISWDWDFGDGSSSTDQSPNYTYASHGNYTVSLTVTDDAGASDSASASFRVKNGGSTSGSTVGGGDGGTTETTEPEKGKKKCNDGLDNDGDSLIDGADPDCQ